MGVFARIMARFAVERTNHETVMIDATYLKAHRVASSLRLKKGGRGRLIGLTKRGMNTKLYGDTDSLGRPRRFFISAGQLSDYA